MLEEELELRSHFGYQPRRHHAKHTERLTVGGPEVYLYCKTNFENSEVSLSLRQ